VIKEQLRASFLHSASSEVQWSPTAILHKKEKVQEITKANVNVYLRATSSRETIHTSNSVDIIWHT